MTGSKKYLVSLAAASAMLFSMQGGSLLSIYASAERPADHLLGDEGEYDVDGQGWSEWDVFSGTDSIEIHWDEAFLKFNRAYDENGKLIAVRPKEQYIYRKLDNGKWQRSAELKYRDEKPDGSDYTLEDFIEYHEEGLEPATAYTFKLVTHVKGDPDNRWAVKFTTMTRPEAVPNVTGQTSSNAVRLNWSPIKCDGYLIKKRNRETGWWETIETVDKDTTTVRLTGFEPEKTNEFAVFGYVELKDTMLYDSLSNTWSKGSKIYESPWVDKGVWLTTKPDGQPADKNPDDYPVGSIYPYALKDDITDTSIKIRWKYIDGGSFKILQETDGEFKEIFDTDDDKNAGFHDYIDGGKYTVTGLKPNTYYTFKVQSKFLGGITEPVTFRTSPAKVKIKSISTSENSLRLNWDKVSCDGYKVQIYNYKNKTWKSIETLGSDVTTAKIAKPADSSKYKVRVRAYTKIDPEKEAPIRELTTDSLTHWGEPSETSAVETKSASLKAPAIKSTSKSNKSIRLNWNKVSGATGYKIYQYTDSGYTCVKTINSADTLTAKLTGFEAGTGYRFKIIAFKKSGFNMTYSDYSAEKEVVTKK